MANLAQFDLKPSGEEARTRALLEDLTEYHTGVYEHNNLALAVWFGKTPKSQEHSVLELFSGIPKQSIAESRFSLHWRAGSEAPPFVNLRATSVEYFSSLLSAHSDQVAPYMDRFEVLYFDTKLLSREILDAFKIVTEPHGIIKGWYVSESEYVKSRSIQHLLSLHGHARPNLGLVKTGESDDFENCRGLLHIEVGQRWVPLSPEGLQPYAYYNDLQSGRPVYFLFEGGSLYQVLKFEVKTAPEYAGRLLGKTINDRYPEVYLRAVHPSAQPTA
jgi:hypothetical protein